MNKHLLFISLLILSKSFYSQFFPDSNAVWQVMGNNWNMSVMAPEDRINYFYSIGSDTLLNGKTYQKITLRGEYQEYEWVYNNPPNPTLEHQYTINYNLYFGGVREQDSLVFFIDTNNIETMVMRFNVNAGDTIYNITPEQSHDHICNFGYDIDTIYVDSIRDEIVNGINFRSVFVHETEYGQNEVYIQNIGKLGGLFWNRYPDVSNCFGFQLESFCWESESYSSWFSSSSPTVMHNSNCSFVGLDNISSSQINVYPIPANDELIIEMQSGKIAQFRLVNISGVIAQSGVFTSIRNTLLISELPVGVYFLEIKDTSNNIDLRKIEIIH